MITKIHDYLMPKRGMKRHGRAGVNDHGQCLLEQSKAIPPPFSSHDFDSRKTYQ